MRSSKSLTNSQSQSGNASAGSNITPRRYTRSSARHQCSSGNEEVGGHASSGSTPTQDEVASYTDDLSRAMPISLVVLSDICASQTKLPSTVDKSLTSSPDTNSSTPVKDEQKERTVNATKHGETGEVSIDSKDSAPLNSQEHVTESYEPELHFEEMSRDMAESADASHSQPSLATPTLDEPTSPDRVTESPTSPTPSSPTECNIPIVSSSMVTIPLEGDDSNHMVVAGPPMIPYIPTGSLLRLFVHFFKSDLYVYFTAIVFSSSFLNKYLNTSC